jgi:hypothetical protein
MHHAPNVEIEAQMRAPKIKSQVPCLLAHIQVLKCNSHSLNEMVMPTHLEYGSLTTLKPNQYVQGIQKLNMTYSMVKIVG